ncbi:hypothetical protein ACFQX6_67475 [Streptosporangium lutulentum]
MTAFYSAYVGGADDMVKYMRAAGCCAPGSVRGSGGHPHVYAADLHERMAEPGQWCLVWAEAPVEMWDGCRNTGHPDHLLAVIHPSGMSTPAAMREAAILIARLRVARAEWELAKLLI